MQVPSPLNKKTMAILMAINPNTMVKAKATNVTITERSVRFDLPQGMTDGINRVKVTNMGDGTLRVQLLRLEEVDLVGGVPPENLAQVLESFVGISA